MNEIGAARKLKVDWTPEMLKDLEEKTWPESVEDALVKTLQDEIEKEIIKELSEKPERLCVSFAIDTESDFLTRWKNGEYDETRKYLIEQIRKDEDEYWKQKEQSNNEI